MIPASLPICVFFTLYVVAAAGFSVAQLFMMEGAPRQRGDLFWNAASSAFWPVLALWLVFTFVKTRGPL